MGEEEEICLSLLSLKDFEERGVKIDQQRTSLDALVAVASVASEKLEEENTKNNPVKSNCYCSGKFELPSSSRTCDKGGQKPVRNLPHSILDMHYKKGVKETNAVAALKQPTTNSVFDDVYPKKKELGFVTSSPKKLLGDAMKSNIRYREVHDEACEVEYCMRQKKKWKRDYENKKPKRGRQIVQNARPGLPQDFRARIEEMNGSRVYLVIQKSLFTSDINNGQTRFSMPDKQIISPDQFLTDNEKRDIVNGGKMKVKLIEPSLQECDLILTRWKARSVSYVLINGWKDVKNRNKLEEGDIVQVWSFRTPPAEALCLALVLVRKGTELVVDGNHNNEDDDGDNASKDG